MHGATRSLMIGRTSTRRAVTCSIPNVRMKVTRVGEVFNAYVSSDGTNWTDVFHKTPAINSNATAGLFVCSHKSGVLGTATFDNVSYTPGP